MSKTKETASSRAIVVTRVYAAPIERVWEAWTLPGPLRQWWAPEGCTTPSCEVDLKSGGRFHYCMRMSDGNEIWGLGVYKEVVALQKLVYVDSFADEKGNPVPASHYGMSASHPQETLVTVTFAAKGAKTEVTLRHEFPETVAERKDTEAGWSGMLDKLAEHLAGTSAKGEMKMTKHDPKLDLRFERVVDVPRELVWEAWTKPEHIKVWFTPAPWKTVDCEIDLRPGGAFKTVMQSPEGQKFPSAGCYLEIVPNAKLVWTSALLPGYRPAKLTANPGHECAELAMTAIILLEPQGKKTKYTAIVLHGDPESRQRHADMGFEDGWGKALDQLVEHMKKENGSWSIS